MRARYEPVDLPAFTGELAGMFRSAIERVGLALVVDCPPMQDRVFIDCNMWEKIVLNLLANAFKFTFEGQIEVCLRRKDASAELCVSDTGTGIPLQDLPRLFERFHRIEGARGRTIEGSGIGIALIHELVKLHRGTVSVDSVEGRGSSFTVSIPLGRGHLPAERIAASDAVRVPSKQAGAFIEEALSWLDDSEAARSLPPYVGTDESRREHRPRVLFADANADIRLYVDRILGGRHEVHVAMDGEAALRVARENPPDLVLADVTMPRLDGFELLEALRADARTRDVPVILLSARADEGSRVEGLERGAVDYLAKPFSSRELLARIDARLEIARLHRASVEREKGLRAAAEESEARMREELVAEIDAMSRLHELSTRWLTDIQSETLLKDMLDNIIQLVKADFGNLQLYDAESRTLKMVAQRGFTKEFLDYFHIVEEGTAACGLALQRRTRVVVENVLTDPSFALHLHVVRAAAFQSMQSTPLISRKGEVLGVISTYFREPRQLSARELRLLDLYARQAAELLERRQAEERLRRSEERFRRYFDLGLIGGALTSSDKGCLEVNDELCRILGYEREELLNKHLAEMTHADDLAADIRQFELIMAGEIDGYLIDKRWIRKDGAIVDSIMAARAVRRGDGTVDYLVGLVLDITARKHAEEALQRLQVDLEHVWRIATLGEMASWIAHELAQPLAAIIANANACQCWLANEPNNLQEANAATTRIVRDATRASQVIARIRALVTRRELERTAFHLGEVIRETVGIAEAEIRRHEISLSCNVASELPLVVGDRVHVQQVILNLLKNAVEAMEPVLDRERILLITADALTEESLRVAVRDSGKGLARQQRERVFDAFHSTKPGGMGMGLAISRSIVEAHGGRLWVTDNDGPGVTFQFTLPSEEAPEFGMRQTTRGTTPATDTDVR